MIDVFVLWMILTVGVIDHVLDAELDSYVTAERVVHFQSLSDGFLLK